MLLPPPYCSNTLYWLYLETLFLPLLFCTISWLKTPPPPCWQITSRDLPLGKTAKVPAGVGVLTVPATNCQVPLNPGHTRECGVTDVRVAVSHEGSLCLNTACKQAVPHRITLHPSALLRVWSCVVVKQSKSDAKIRPWCNMSLTRLCTWCGAQQSPKAGPPRLFDADTWDEYPLRGGRKKSAKTKLPMEKHHPSRDLNAYPARAPNPRPALLTAGSKEKTS